MRCEEIQPNLPLYLDNVLEANEREAVESHLPTCPLCRAELSDYREIRLSLGRLEMPSIPDGLKTELLIAARKPNKGAGSFGPVLDTGGAREWLSHWMLPFTAGAFGSVAFGILLLSLMLVRPGIAFFEQTQTEVASNTTVPIESPAPFDQSDDYLRIEIPESSPEVNPAGALVALTRSIVRGKMSDEEVVVVADVFGNGIAQIKEVVEPPDDDQAMKELRRAFATSPEDAPFLPARMSGNTDAVRVVLKIQRVDVVDN